MPRKLLVYPHLSLEELEMGYNQATSAIARFTRLRYYEYSR
ncbi:hypothetical protein [Okeania sp. SIO1I7]|nr:hypothetical protein [Okeania sp. SIO1I7]